MLPENYTVWIERAKPWFDFEVQERSHILSAPGKSCLPEPSSCSHCWCSAYRSHHCSYLCMLLLHCSHRLVCTAPEPNNSCGFTAVAATHGGRYALWAADAAGDASRTVSARLLPTSAGAADAPWPAGTLSQLLNHLSRGTKKR